MNNSLASTMSLLRILKVKFSKNSIEEMILSHPDHMSLLSISNTLDNCKVNNLAIQADANDFDNLPLPFIAQVKVEDENYFYTIKKVVRNRVVFYNQFNQIKKEEKTRFFEQWTGISLLVEKTMESRDPEFNNYGDFFTENVIKFLLAPLIILLFGWMVIENIQSADIPLFSKLGFIFIKILGTILGVILLWFDVDKTQNEIKKFCGLNSRTSCEEVLGSKQSKILNGFLDLSTLVFAYFASTTILIICIGFNKSSLGILALLNLFSLPFILYSFYSQAYIIKKWCLLCLLTSALLTSEFFTIYPMLSAYKSLNVLDVLLLITFFLVLVISWKKIKFLLQTKKEYLNIKRNYNKLKLNKDVFETRLKQSIYFGNPSPSLGIDLPSKNSNIKITKICNPYCSPCANAHPILDELYEIGKIDLQIIFTSRASPEDKKYLPVKHLITLNNSAKKSDIINALNFWYTSSNQNYDELTRKYKCKADEVDVNSKIDDMFNWCKVNKISRTPTILINGFEMPSEYSLSNLRDILV